MIVDIDALRPRPGYGRSGEAGEARWMWLGLSVRVGEANGVASRRLPGRGGEHEFTAVNTYEEEKLKLSLTSKFHSCLHFLPFH